MFFFSLQECTVQIERLDIKLDEVIAEKENANTLNKTDENNCQVKRYRTRSSVSQTESLEIKSEIQRKRSQSSTEPKPKPAFIEYNGKVEYYTEFHDIAFAADTLL